MIERLKVFNDRASKLTFYPAAQLDRFASLAMTGEGVRQPCVYVMANKRNGTLYVGVTSDLARRAFEHRTGAVDGFTYRYGCKRLVWYEPHTRIEEAIAREKQIKAGSRAKKLAMIESMNPEWKDLYELLNQ